MTGIKRALLLTLAIAAVLAAIPATASAGWNLQMPAATLSSGWTVNPSGSAHTVLDDYVWYPSAPSTSGDNITSNAAGPVVTELQMQPQPLAAGETVSYTSAAVYLSTASNRTVTIELLTGGTTLGTNVVPGGTAAKWEGVTSTQALTQAQLNDLRIRLTQSGSGGGSANVYAAQTWVYLVPPPAATPAAPSTPSTGTSTPAVPAKPPAVSTKPTSKPASEPLKGASLTVPTGPVTVGARPVIPLTVGCPPAASERCYVTVALTGKPAAGKGKKSKAKASRCARGCRDLGRQKLEVTRGKKRKVRVASRVPSSKLFGRRKTTQVDLKVEIRDAAGHSTTRTDTVTLKRG